MSNKCYKLLKLLVQIIIGISPLNYLFKYLSDIATHSPDNNPFNISIFVMKLKSISSNTTNQGYKFFIA